MTLPRPPILLTYINPRPCHPNPLPTAEHLPSKPLALHNINPRHTLHTDHHKGWMEHKVEKAIKLLNFTRTRVGQKKIGEEGAFTICKKSNQTDIFITTHQTVKG